MKKVLRTEVINRQIVREYRKYREDLLLKRMLRAIGDYVFQAKILAKRVGYLRKMRREELFNAFLSKLI